MMFAEIEDKEKYFIQPYISGKHLTILIYMLNNMCFLRAFDDNDTKTKLLKQIAKELKKAYAGSKYNTAAIVLKGFLVLDKKNRESLILYDIFTKEEYSEKMQSKKYEVRLENLNFRFLTNKLKSVKSIFSHSFSEQSLKLFIELFVKNCKTEKIVYKKNCPRHYFDENEIVIDDIWTNRHGEIVGVVPAEAVKREVDDNQNIVSETPYKYAKSFNFKDSETGEVVEVELSNFTDAEKVEILEKADNFLHKSFDFKQFKILENNGYVFLKQN